VFWQGLPYPLRGRGGHNVDKLNPAAQQPSAKEVNKLEVMQRLKEKSLS